MEYNITPIMKVFLSILHKRAVGELTYEEFGKKFLMVQSRSTGIMYMGYAVKHKKQKPDHNS